jgi:hypothetical protein
MNIKSESSEYSGSKLLPNVMASTYSPSLINFFNLRFGCLNKPVISYQIINEKSTI